MTAKAADSVKYTFLFLEQKVALMSQYLSFTRTMKDSFVSKKGIPLEGLLAKRQECIEKIEKIDLSLKKIKSLDAGAISRISRELKGKLNGYLQRIKGLVEQIAPIDDEVMVMIQEESRVTKDELIKMKTVKQATKGYGSKERCIPRYVDARR